MTTRETIALLATAIALLVAAGMTHSLGLWSVLGNYTVPWFCGALAVALLIVTLTAVLTDSPLGGIPVSRRLVVLLGSSIIVVAGLVVDGLCYGFPEDSWGSVGEWIGFTTMLAILFWIPGIKKEASGEPDAGPVSSEDTAPDDPPALTSQRG